MNVRFAFSHNFGTGLDLYDSLAPTRWNLAFQRRISEIHACSPLQIIHYSSTVVEFPLPNKTSHLHANVIPPPSNEIIPDIIFQNVWTNVW